MRYLILSDVHANLEALRAVQHHVRRKRFDRVLFLGDAVGYGAAPNQVLSWLRSLGGQVTVVRGNHDRVCAGLDDGQYFNRYAQQSVEWTYDHLEERNLDLLRRLPQGPLEVTSQIAVAHGSPADEDAYIFSGFDAQAAFGALPHPIVLFGHTHIPSLFTLEDHADGRRIRGRMLSGRRVTLDLDSEHRYLINPGSVGQPRDRDPRAAYAIYDDSSRRLFLYRVPYPAEAARQRILQAGLPPILGDRLLHGA
jgi:predicted phosphodiesterase